MRRLAMGQLSDGRLQLFSTSVDQNQLYTCWKKTDSTQDESWWDWKPFDVPPFVVGGISDIAALQLPDGRLQLWCVSSFDGVIYYCRKSTPTPSSAWTGWNPFPGPPITITQSSAYFLSAAEVILDPDAVLGTQLFLSAGGEGLWTNWQLLNFLSNPDVDLDPWAGWQTFPPGSQTNNSAMAGWCLVGGAQPRTAVWSYDAGAAKGFLMYVGNPEMYTGNPPQFIKDPNSVWVLEPLLLGSIEGNTVTATAGVQYAPNLGQVFVANQYGPTWIQSGQINPTPDGSYPITWSNVGPFPWDQSVPVDCFAAGQRQDGTGQLFASYGNQSIQTCWSAGSGWTPWSNFPSPPT